MSYRGSGDIWEPPELLQNKSEMFSQLRFTTEHEQLLKKIKYKDNACLFGGFFLCSLLYYSIQAPDSTITANKL